MQCEKHTKSGKLLEVDFYPVWADGRKMPTRSPKTKPSSKAKEKYNKNQALKNFVRMICANFDNTDYLLHITYIPALAPQTEEEARRDITNYYRRVKRKRESKLKELEKKLKSAKGALSNTPDNIFLQESIFDLKKQIKKLKSPFKFAYTIEEQIYKTGIHKGKSNWHFHIFATGGLPDTTLENMWGKGLRCNCDNYQPEKFGPETAAKYLMKDPRGVKKYAHSKNMDKPIEVYKKAGSVSRSQVERMARLRNDDAEYWERKYKGYRFIRCFPRFNEYNGNWYVSVIMYRASDCEEIPKWNMQKWFDEEIAEGGGYG